MTTIEEVLERINNRKKEFVKSDLSPKQIWSMIGNREEISESILGTTLQDWIQSNPYNNIA